MVLRKAIIQVYSGNETFDVNDFIRGTLRLLNYASDNNVDFKINISGSNFEQYMSVVNSTYNASLYSRKIYYADIDDKLLNKDLDAFILNSEPFFILCSNVFLERNDIYNSSYIMFNSLIKFKNDIISDAKTRVLANLLYRRNSDNLLYGYNIIYIERDAIRNMPNKRDIVTIANQIRGNITLNYDTIVFSNNIQLRNILSRYIEKNPNTINDLDESIIDLGLEESYISVRDNIVNYLILLNARKIYRFIDTLPLSIHNTNILSKKNNLIGNLENTLDPLSYLTSTIAGCPDVTSLTLSQPRTYNNSGRLQSLLNNPSGLALDTSGNMYIADTSNNRICKLDSSSNFSIYAGSTISGYLNGSSLIALFNQPSAIAIDKLGNLYVADTGNHAIRLIQQIKDSNGTIKLMINTLAGNGSTGQVIDSAIGSGNLLNSPRGIAVDTSGTIYISDTGNNRICKITSGGNLVTIAGSKSFYSSLTYVAGYIDGNVNESSFNKPTGLALDLAGNIYVADTDNNVIRKIIGDKVITIAGIGVPCFKEGIGKESGFNKPRAVAVDINNNVYISDTGNNCIRRIGEDNRVKVVAGVYDQLPGSRDGLGRLDVNGTSSLLIKRALFSSPTAILVDPSNNIYITDSHNNTIRKISVELYKLVKIRPIPFQTIKIIRAHGVAYNLGPTISAILNPNNIIYGRKRGNI